MVYVAQLAECLIVVQEVMGSTPIIHTTRLCGETGKHNGLKLRTLRVRVPPEILCSVSSTDRTPDYGSGDRSSNLLRST